MLQHRHLGLFMHLSKNLVHGRTLRCRNTTAARPSGSAGSDEPPEAPPETHTQEDRRTALHLPIFEDCSTVFDGQ